MMNPNGDKALYVRAICHEVPYYRECVQLGLVFYHAEVPLKDALLYAAIYAAKKQHDCVNSALQQPKNSLKGN